MHRGASNSAPNVKRIVVAELSPATAHLEANSHKDQGTQRDRHIDDLPNMKTLSLGNSDATDQDASGPPRPETVDPAEEILPVSQTVVHINVYISEAPLAGGAQIIHKVSTSAPETRPIATQGVQTVGPPGTSLVACAVGLESVKPEADLAAAKSPQRQHRPTSTVPNPNPVVNEEDEHIAPQNRRHKGKWYVVTRGRRVGVWTSWTDMSSYVTGVPTNCHKSFESRDDALTCYYGAKERGLVSVIAKK